MRRHTEKNCAKNIAPAKTKNTKYKYETKCPYKYHTKAASRWYWHMRYNGAPQTSTEKKEKDYDAPKKNEFRERVVKTFPKGGECLTLDGSQELFSKATPHLRHTVYEYNKKEFGTMQDNPRPRNIETLRPRDIADAPIYDPGKKYDCAFLDWMGTFYTHQKDLERLAPYLDSCKTVAFTFSVWGGHLSVDRTKKGYDYKMDLVGKLMSIFKNFEYSCGMPYCDTSPMVGIILTRRGVAEPTDEITVYTEKQYGPIQALKEAVNEEYPREVSTEIRKDGALVLKQIDK